jgi:hypothetical protein
MRRNIPLNFRVSESNAARRLIAFCTPACIRSFAVAILVALLSRPNVIAAQSPAALTTPASQPSSAPKPVHHRPHRGPTRPPAPKPQAALAAPAPVAPPAPEPPKWPANDQPAQPTVVWDSQGLRIDAANSSLQQILNAVTLATGTKVEGLAADERVFGDYGPGQASDVLAELLQGSSYNVMMVGDRGQGTPREILLSARQKGAPHPVQNIRPANDNEEDTEAEEPAPPEPATPSTPTAGPSRPGVAPGIAPGDAPRTPQEIMQEMQQRQQQLQQQQMPMQQQQMPQQQQQPPQQQ